MAEIIDVKLTERDEERAKRTINFEGFLEKNKLTVGTLFLGLILIGIGVLGLRIFTFTGPKVEILGEEAASEPGAGKITVEAAGEVIKPGVYQLAVASRINDLLTAAGGFSENADREWVGKNLNLALKLQDGAKIYIPSKFSMINDQFSNNAQNSNYQISKININIASEAELDTLWGVGPATAKKIIAGRPFQRPEELLEKKMVKKDVWEEIKNKITVY